MPRTSVGVVGPPLAGGRFCPECGASVAATEDESLAPDTVAQLEAEADASADDLSDPANVRE